MLIILLLIRLRQEDSKFKASLEYIARPCPKTKTNQPTIKYLRGKKKLEVYLYTYYVG